jgi:DNA modification methylase
MVVVPTDTLVLAERDALLDRYDDRLSVNADLDRTLVSFQANKAEPAYRWFKYKEGFSSRVVEYFLERLADRPGVLLDPFAGAGAALFAARDLGWDTVGIELLPVGFYVMDARQTAERVAPEKLAAEIKRVASTDLAECAGEAFAFSHITITADAFSPRTEKEIAGYLAYCEKKVRDPGVRRLLRFASFCVLEEVSFTRKDGQYLRWDHRSARREVRGHFHKGRIPPFREAVLRKLGEIADDLAHRDLFARPPGHRGSIDLHQGSCLEVLPGMKTASVDFVLTSPPYCNRYDYTRTYALELAFLGQTNEQVKDLRQAMLSCTVENREKREDLRRFYAERSRLSVWNKVDRTFNEQAALQEVLSALDALREADKLNNPNIARMVRNYFYEMAFVVAELARILKPGGKVVMVNDNVRYAGEEVTADLILSDFAESFGLSVRHIWTLPRGKGNSSQQMGVHGRQELRKCVYVWEKP